jgi:hypothetical protein
LSPRSIMTIPVGEGITSEAESPIFKSYKVRLFWLGCFLLRASLSHFSEDPAIHDRSHF